MAAAALSGMIARSGGGGGGGGTPLLPHLAAAAAAAASSSSSLLLPALPGSLACRRAFAADADAIDDAASTAAPPPASTAAAARGGDVFDAAAAGAPLRVHQLIGDPRTGVADDTTTAPWGPDVSVEWVWSSPATGVDWYRYSKAGPDQLPFMYMDARLSDHSKNELYLLRCRDPARWTIPALADKFRIRRQRAMAILALKEMEAHRIDQGAALQGPLSAYAFRVPLADLRLKADGEPYDLAELVALEQRQQRQRGKQQQQRGKQQPPGQEEGQAAAAAASSSSSAAAAAQEEGGGDGGGDAGPLGSLRDFLAPEGGAAAAAAAMGADAAAAEAAGDLAAVMPRAALTAQQLQLQLLELLQRHHFSGDELRRRLLAQVDAAHAYFDAHVAGTPLEMALLGGSGGSGGAAAAAAAGAAEGAGGEAAAEGGGDGADDAAAAASRRQQQQRPAWLDFDRQRQLIEQAMEQLAPLLDRAGDAAEREVSQLAAALSGALAEAEAAGAAAAAGVAAPGEGEASSSSSSGGSSAEALAAAVAAAEPRALAAAFRQLTVEQRRRLLELAPAAKIALNAAGTDLRAAVDDSSSSSSSSSSGFAFAGAAAGVDGGAAAAGAQPRWPGEAPLPVDVWRYEELPRAPLAALAGQLPALQAALAEAEAAALGGGGSGGGAAAASSGGGDGDGDGDGDDPGAEAIRHGDVAALQRAVGVYATLVWDYDRALQQQAAAASASGRAPLLPPPAQRRLARILREMDPHAVDKLLLWESLRKEEALQGGGDRGGRGGGRGGERGGDRRLARLRARVYAAIKALDAAAVEAGHSPHGADGPHPDLPADAPPEARADADMAAAELDATIVGRVFHRGSGDRHFVRVQSFPAFEGRSLEEFDATTEGELSAVARLSAEREDNLMWREFRARVLRNLGLTAPDLFEHAAHARPPKPLGGWSYVVHPTGGAARTRARRELREERRRQWLNDDGGGGGNDGDALMAGDFGPAAAPPPPPPTDVARGPAPAVAYVAEPGGALRALNEEEALVAGHSRAKPRRRWYLSTRGRPR